MRKLYICLFSAFLIIAASPALAEDDFITDDYENLDVLNIEEMEKHIMDKQNMDRHIEHMQDPKIARLMAKKVSKPQKPTQPSPLIENGLPEYSPPTGSSMPDLVARISYLEEQNRNLNGILARLEHEIEQLKTAPAKDDKSLKAASEQYVARPGDVNAEYVIKVDGVTEDDGEVGVGVDGEVGGEVDLEEQDFDAAVADISAQKLPAAKDKLKNFITVHPKSERVDEAYFWLGEISVDEADFKSAALNYLKSYKADKNGKRAEEALLKSSTALGKLGKKEEACRNLTQLRKMETLQDLLREQANSEAIKLGCK